MFCGFRGSVLATTPTCPLPPSCPRPPPAPPRPPITTPKRPPPRPHPFPPIPTSTLLLQLRDW